jgi:hypothetical protein
MAPREGEHNTAGPSESAWAGELEDQAGGLMVAITSLLA